jgi:hypothetical protein
MSESEDPGSGLQPLKPGKPWMVQFAYAYFILLILGIVGAAAASMWLGIIELNAQFTFQADLGWLVEYLAAGLLAVFLLFTFVQFVRITGIGFIRGLIGTIARIAHNYELPEEAQPNTEEDQES